MSFYTRDEDEYERQRREAATLGALLQDSQGQSFKPDMTFSLEETEGAAGYTPPERRAPMQEPSSDSGDGIGDALANYGIPALAAFLDIVTNKGKGLGPILAAQGIQSNQRALGRVDQAKDRMQDARYQQQYAGDAESRRLREEGLRIALASEKRKGQPKPEDEARRAAEVDQLVSQAELNRARAYGGDSGSEDRDLDRAQRKQMHDEALADRKEGRAASALDRDEARKGREAEAEARRSRQAGEDYRKAADQFSQRTDEERSQASQLKGAEPIIEKYRGKDMPGVGKFDNMRPTWSYWDDTERADATELRKRQGEAAQYFKHEITGSASSDREQQMLKALKSVESGTEEEFRAAMQLWSEEVKGKLRARSVGNPAAREVLDSQGIGDWTYRAGNGKAQAAGQQPMSSGTSGMVQMTDPEGETGPVPADQAARLEAMGYRRAP